MRSSKKLVGPAVLAVVLAAMLVPAVSSGVEGYLRYPTINGNTVVFSCEGDLWTVPADGGMARRLTEGEGSEVLPHFSPDGSRIAFTAEYEGNNDVYVIPRDGGEPLRLTYHPFRDEVIGWTPDGKDVVFRSMRYSVHPVYKAFTVPAQGGFPVALPLDKVSFISYSPDGKRITFTRNATEGRTWKRYKGGLAQDVWVGDLTTMVFKKLTDYEGTDGYPLWVGDRIYFVSDRDGIMNIYSMNTDGGDIKQHTTHKDYDVRWPAYAGGKIVYECGGDLWLFDVGSGRDAKMQIDVPSDRAELRPRYINPAKFVSDFEISPEGRRIAFCSRGDIEIVPAKEGRLIDVSSGSDVRAKDPRWSPDGKWLAYISDATGEEEIYAVDAEHKDEAKQITKSTNIWKFPAVPSPDGKKLAYADATFKLFILDRDSGKATLVDTSDVWEIDQYAWSPDSKWLAYAKPEDFRFNSIFIYDTGNSKITRVTDKFTNDLEPTWDPNGKYLYFLSDRTLNPFLSKRGFEAILDKMTKPYLVMLQAGQKSPFFPKEPSEQGEEKDEEAAAGKSGKDTEEAKAEKSKEKTEGAGKQPAEVKIDLDGIMDRVVEFPVPAGQYSSLQASSDRVFYLSGPSLGMAPGDDEEGNTSVNDLHAFDIKEKEDKVIEEGIDSYQLAYEGKKIVYKRGETFATVDASKSDKSDSDEAKSKVDLARWHLRVDPKLEFKQMFDEGWRLQRDFYWAPDMAKIDWPAVKVKYEKLLPRIATRNDLNDLIGNVIGELATSHTYIWGGDVKRPDRVPVGLLGADVAVDEASGCYKITKIFPTEPSSPDDVSPLTLSHAGVKVGDFILAVNGKPLKAPTNFYSMFVNLANDEVLLTVNGKSSRDGARDVIIKTVADESKMRYLDWVRSNREYVAKETDGKCGYFHIPDMGSGGLVEFSRTFFPQIELPAFIVDERYNGGGFVSEIILERIGRPLLARGASRRGRDERYPADAVYAHRVLLVNEDAGSDGDIFPQAFKLAKLGPVVGMRTWGGIVGIRMDKPFVDGGLMTIPEFPWWENNGGWTLENRGVEPDVEVDNLPGDEFRGIDRQLDKAIELIKESLKQDPMTLPSHPPYPDKSMK
ncbi:MAG TPA: S41 family peptidase [bacterium]|nr:S41 family peptidase [bacterium]